MTGPTRGKPELGRFGVWVRVGMSDTDAEQEPSWVCRLDAVVSIRVLGAPDRLSPALTALAGPLGLSGSDVEAP